jgi:hypothetical protein
MNINVSKFLENIVVCKRATTFLALATGRQTDQQLADKITYSGDLNHGRKVTSALNMMI